MATYAELFDLHGDDDLKNKLAVAVTIKAQTLLDLSSPTAAQVAWADAAIQNPVTKALTLLNYVLAKNNTSSVGQIQSASDATIQSNVDDAVDKLIV